VSMNTGLPTVLGWGYHVFQRAHPWADINRRKADIQTVYTSDSKDMVAGDPATLPRGAGVRRCVGAAHVCGANLERFKEWTDLLTPVYQNPGVTLFAVNGRFTGAMPVTTIEELPRVAGEEQAPPPQDAPGRLQQPRGLAVNAEGDVLVCDFGNNRVQEFGSDLHFVRAWGTRGELPGQFREPCAVAVGPSGEIFVADTWNQRVQVFSPKGDYVREFAASFYGPRGIAVDAKGGVFVADTGNNRIVRFSAAGLKEREWGGKGSEPGKFMEPMGVEPTRRARSTSATTPTDGCRSSRATGSSSRPFRCRDGRARCTPSRTSPWMHREHLGDGAGGEGGTQLRQHRQAVAHDHGQQHSGSDVRDADGHRLQCRGQAVGHFRPRSSVGAHSAW